MPWSECHMQARAVQVLRRVIANGRVAHAYLFSGVAGSGKQLAARLFAQAQNCETSTEDPCGRCRTCNLIARSMDPEKPLYADLMHLAPGMWVYPGGRRQRSDAIVIDAVRELQSRLYNAPLEARQRVVVVHRADRMQESAQNAFLKTLEEPRQKLRTIFILLSARPQHLLPTIRSRCQEVRFGSVAAAHIMERLTSEYDLDESTARSLAILADGSLGVAEELAADGRDALERRRVWIELWRGAVEGTDVRSVVDLGRSREECRAFLDFLLGWHRDLIGVKTGVDPSLLINQDHLYALEQEADLSSVAKLIRRLERVRTIIDELDVFVRGDLALQRLLLESVPQPSVRR